MAARSGARPANELLISAALLVFQLNCLIPSAAPKQRPTGSSSSGSHRPPPTAKELPPSRLWARGATSRPAPFRHGLTTNFHCRCRQWRRRPPPTPLGWPPAARAKSNYIAGSTFKMAPLQTRERVRLGGRRRARPASIKTDAARSDWLVGVVLFGCRWCAGPSGIVRAAPSSFMAHVSKLLLWPSASSRTLVMLFALRMTAPFATIVVQRQA
jgi:hypothetical protein